MGQRLVRKKEHDNRVIVRHTIREWSEHVGDMVAVFRNRSPRSFNSCNFRCSMMEGDARCEVHTRRLSSHTRQGENVEELVANAVKQHLDDDVEMLFSDTSKPDDAGVCGSHSVRTDADGGNVHEQPCIQQHRVFGKTEESLTQAVQGSRTSQR